MGVLKNVKKAAAGKMAKMAQGMAGDKESAAPKNEKLDQLNEIYQEQEEQLAEQRETRKTEKDTLHTHEVRITGNDVQSLTEKLVSANAPSKNSPVSGITGVDIKI